MFSLEDTRVRGIAGLRALEHTLGLRFLWHGQFQSVVSPAEGHSSSSPLLESHSSRGNLGILSGRVKIPVVSAGLHVLILPFFLSAP